jgi:hypothetical protein
MANLSQSDDELDFSELLSVKRILIVVDAINDNDANSYGFVRLFETTREYGARIVLILTGTYYRDYGSQEQEYATVKLHCETRPKFFRSRAFGLARCEGSQLLAVLVKCYHSSFVCCMSILTGLQRNWKPYAAHWRRTKTTPPR